MTKIPAKLTTYLKANKIIHQVLPHKTVFTAYDLAQTLRYKLEEIAKTLLVKAGSEYRLIVLRASDRLDLKKLQTLLGVSNVKIAREQDMVREMNVKPGAITPFGSIHKLNVVLERGLLKARLALFGSGSFEHAIRMSVKDFVRYERPTVGSFGVSAGLRLQKPAAKPGAKRTLRKKKTTKKRRR